MRISIYHVDAFTTKIFKGNPAAVCPLESWLPDHTLQSIAFENNLAETAFFIGWSGEYEIRWFTPATEVDLCGHATLAAAHVIFDSDPGLEEIKFRSKGGPLKVKKDGQRLCLDFPAREPSPCPIPPGLELALGRKPKEVLASRDYLAVYESEDEVRSLRPDMIRLAALDRFGIIVTAPGRSSDFVSRFFAPAQGIPEDPVTGSAHCTLVPYWKKRLGKDHLHAFQVSFRGGELFCGYRGDRVLIAGQAVKYLEGTIEVPVFS